LSDTAQAHRVKLCGFEQEVDQSHASVYREFLQLVSIACYAERCISYSKSVRPSDTRWHCVKTTQATIMRSSLYIG